MGSFGPSGLFGEGDPEGGNFPKALPDVISVFFWSFVCPDFVSWELFGDKLATWTFRGNVQPLALRAVDIYGPLALLLGCCVVEVFLRGTADLTEWWIRPFWGGNRARDGVRQWIRDFVDTRVSGVTSAWCI